MLYHAFEVEFVGLSYGSNGFIGDIEVTVQHFELRSGLEEVFLKSFQFFLDLNVLGGLLAYIKLLLFKVGLDLVNKTLFDFLELSDDCIAWEGYAAWCTTQCYRT